MPSVGFEPASPKSERPPTLALGRTDTGIGNVYLEINPLNTELNPIRHLLALVGARHIVHVSHPPFASIGSSSPYCPR